MRAFEIMPTWPVMTEGRLIKPEGPLGRGPVAQAVRQTDTDTETDAGRGDAARR